MLSMLCPCACEPRKLAYAVRNLLLVEDSIMWSDVENVLFSYKVSHKPKIIVYQFANCLFALSISYNIWYIHNNQIAHYTQLDLIESISDPVSLDRTSVLSDRIWLNSRFVTSDPIQSDLTWSDLIICWSDIWYVHQYRIWSHVWQIESDNIDIRSDLIWSDISESDRIWLDSRSGRIESYVIDIRFDLP